MTEQTRKLLDKANRAVLAAESLLKGGHNDFSGSRAYYAMFYAAEALLVERGLQFRKHGSVHAAFGEHFAKTEMLDPKYHRWLLDAFDQRILGDYGVEGILTRDDVARMIEHAREFVSAAFQHLESKP